jgi:hypothetical protein
VEPFEFVVENQGPGIAIESQISNVSYSESLEYPSDGRYFKVILRRTSDVINTHDQMISGADVMLNDDSGLEWHYSEAPSDPGKYYLLDDDFKAIQGRMYRIIVQVADDETYESSWEQLPDPAPAMGNIGFKESEIFKQVRESGEEVIKSIPGIWMGIELPEIDDSESLFYRWDFEPMWVYEAPFASISQPDVFKTCWAINEYYLSDYEVHTDISGGYTKDLLFIEVPGNERILWDFSLLVRQYTVSDKFYNFWNELKQQTQRGNIFDAPPYNLQTNFTSITGNNSVSGYFGVVQEQATRWYFKTGDLSYPTEEFITRVCEEDLSGPGFPAPGCLDCMGYENGIPTNIRPEWWGN